jgi:two-component system LytT family response regulator
MRPLRTLIVDDEELCRKGIRLILEEDDEFQIIGECANGDEAIKAIEDKNPEVVFLDILMPEITGFDVLKSIDPDKWPVIVFVTAYDEHAVKAFEVHALDYVLKPFTKARFTKTLEQVKRTIRDRDVSEMAHSLMQLMSRLESSHGAGESPVLREDGKSGAAYLDRLLVSERGAHKVVWVRDIEWIEGADYYVHLHCRGKSLLYRERLKNLEDKLSPDNFFRVHKSAIINLNYMDKITADYKKQIYALMKSGARVRISRNRKKDFFSLCRDKYGLKTEQK